MSNAVVNKWKQELMFFAFVRSIFFFFLTNRAFEMRDWSSLFSFSHFIFVFVFLSLTLFIQNYVVNINLWLRPHRILPQLNILLFSSMIAFLSFKNFFFFKTKFLSRIDFIALRSTFLSIFRAFIWFSLVCFPLKWFLLIWRWKFQRRCWHSIWSVTNRKEKIYGNKQFDVNSWAHIMTRRKKDQMTFLTFMELC